MKVNLKKVLMIAGLICFVIGSLDPLEGSPLIAIGSILIFAYAWLGHDKHLKFFILFTVLILVGVAALFYVSGRGGIGPEAMPNYYYLILAPYPLGWLCTLGLLIFKAVKKDLAF